MHSLSHSPLEASVLVLNRLFMAVHVISARRAFCLLCKDLADGVDAGVGAATGVAADPLVAGDCGDAGFQRLLHRAVPRLRLPPAEIGAVIGQGEFDVAHDRPKKS